MGQGDCREGSAMKSFFKGMNLARGIMLLALVGSLVLGWMGWNRSQELEEMLINRDKDRSEEHTSELQSQR